MADMLEIKDIHVYYGAIHAIKGVSLTVRQGEIVTLIGSNGAGKSTTLRTVSGLLKPKEGDILFEGESIAGRPAQEIVKAGISQVPEGRRIFANMTVLENLELGAFTRDDADGVEADMNMVFERFPRLLRQRGTAAHAYSDKVAALHVLPLPASSAESNASAESYAASFRSFGGTSAYTSMPHRSAAKSFSGKPPAAPLSFVTSTLHPYSRNSAAFKSAEKTPCIAMTCDGGMPAAAHAESDSADGSTRTYRRSA